MYKLKTEKGTVTPDSETYPSPKTYFKKKKKDILKGGVPHPHQNP